MIWLAQRVILSEGWQRRAIAFGAGSIGALAMPPFNFLPAFFAPMMVSVWLLDGSAGKSASFSSTGAFGWVTSGLSNAAGIGWWLGFGYFTSGLWWLGAAFLVEADKFAWAMPLGVVALPALLAGFNAIGFALARLLWSPGVARIFALAVGLGAAEWLRGHVLTGFPWNDFGMVLGAQLWLAQTASLTGLFGLTVLAIILFALPALVADGRHSLLTVCITPALALGVLAGFGALRVAGGETETVKGVRLRIMQPNVQHDMKFRTTASDELVSHYFAVSDQATSPQNNGIADFTHLIWPESPFPFILMRDPKALAKIREKLPAQTILITGAARAEPGVGAKARPTYFNSIYAISSDGAVLDSYDKVHLVPFGEYVPFEPLVRALGLQQFVLSPFTPGARRKLLSVPGLPPIVPLICYEAIFSGEVIPRGADAAGSRPGAILNVTDDSWFGLTPGPYQHLAQARLRAIEEGLPLIRAADSGISAIFDPYGRQVVALPLGVEGVLDGLLPKGLEGTLFSRFRIIASLTIWCIAFISNCILRLRV